MTNFTKQSFDRETPNGITQNIVSERVVYVGSDERIKSKFSFFFKKKLFLFKLIMIKIKKYL